MLPLRIISVVLIGQLFLSCRQQVKEFEKISIEHSGINFTNTITETQAQNVLMYEYYYNGNGVATGDLNGERGSGPSG